MSTIVQFKNKRILVKWKWAIDCPCSEQLRELRGLAGDFLTKSPFESQGLRAFGDSSSRLTTSPPPLSLPPAEKKYPPFLQWKAIFWAVNSSPLGMRASQLVFSGTPVWCFRGPPQRQSQVWSPLRTPFCIVHKAPPTARLLRKDQPSEEANPRSWPCMCVCLLAKSSQRLMPAFIWNIS